MLLRYVFKLTIMMLSVSKTFHSHKDFNQLEGMGVGVNYNSNTTHPHPHPTVKYCIVLITDNEIH